MTKFTVNGNPVQYLMPPATPLLWALRDASNLTGTKFGCGAGLCGACTVHIDGVAQRSCQVAIGDIEGTFVTTIEGLSDDRSHPVQQAWIAEQVPQCGYCQSGMIMAVAALLKTNKHPSDEQIDAAITNLCRCGTYPRIRKAIHRAAAGGVDSGMPGPETTPSEGRPPGPVDGGAASAQELTMAVTGGCRCGNVRYELALDALPRTYACHCLDCQTWTGSAFSQQALLPEEQVTITMGTPVLFELAHPSGTRVSRQYVCGRCHSRLYNTNTRRPGVAVVRAGTLDESDRLAVVMHIWTRRKQPWLAIPDGVPSFPELAPPEAMMATLAPRD